MQAFLLFGICMGTAGATGVTAGVGVCQQGSLASYIALDASGGCSLGSYTFFRFAAPTPTSTGNPLVGNASDITVTPILTATTVGFAFSAVVNGTNYFSIPNPTQSESINYFINYSFDPAPVEPGEDLSLDPPFGNVTATQQYCVNNTFDSNCQPGTVLSQTVTVGSPDSTVLFPGAVTLVDIQTNISLVASPGNPSGFDSLTSVFDLSPTITPEPAFIAPLGLSVLLLGAFYRRRSGSKKLSS